MDIDVVKAKVRHGDFVVSDHASTEAEDEEISFEQIRNAILNDTILEQYEDTGRGESCLILGFVKGWPIHAVCGWRGENIVVITTYVPREPWFSDPWTRRSK